MKKINEKKNIRESRYSQMATHAHTNKNDIYGEKRCRLKRNDTEIFRRVTNGSCLTYKLKTNYTTFVFHIFVDRLLGFVRTSKYSNTNALRKNILLSMTEKTKQILLKRRFIEVDVFFSETLSIYFFIAFQQYMTHCYSQMPISMTRLSFLTIKRLRQMISIY